MQLKNHSNTAGLLLFVAELYTQLHHENIYGKFLIDAFKHLLSVGGNANIKSICQSLKVSFCRSDLQCALKHLFTADGSLFRIVR